MRSAVPVFLVAGLSPNPNRASLRAARHAAAGAAKLSARWPLVAASFFFVSELIQAVLTIDRVADFLERFAPTHLAEEWDNVGLLVGDRRRPLQRIMTCLTLTEKSIDEAVDKAADLVVSHHPLPFRPLRRLSSDTLQGRRLLKLIRAEVAVYSPHTAFDSAGQGINERLAQGLGLSRIMPLVPAETEFGSGRIGVLKRAVSAGDLAQRVKTFLQVEHVQLVGRVEAALKTVAVGCGSAGELLPQAIDQGCDAMVLGETRFHTCLDAEAADIVLILPGHYASERFAVEQLADVLTQEFPQAEVWASRREHDPLAWL